MRVKLVVIGLALIVGVVSASAVALAATPSDDVVAICNELYGDVFGVPNGEPLGACQWNMALIGATSELYDSGVTGKGVKVGVIDSGVDFTHPDVAPNLDVDLSCSFIYDDTPTADPAEIANGDCSNKAAVQDLNGHGTHVATTIAAPVNGIGIAGVAPEATIVAMKVCTIEGFCFADSVAAALRYAGDQGLDVVNLSLFADPYLYYCKPEKEQRAILKELESAARYAQQKGVMIVASAGNETADLQHPVIDDISPDWPPDSAEVRYVKNNCRVAPAELPGVLTVSATGPIGYPDYNLWIADYSSVGMSRVDVAAPGGDFFRATGTVQDAILAGLPIGSAIWNSYDPLNAVFPGITTIDGGGYVYLNGTSMASPHAAGVAALVVQQHPKWSPGSVKAAVQASALQVPCPPDWEPLYPYDQRYRCYGNNGRTSFFGHGLVQAGDAKVQVVASYLDARFAGMDRTLFLPMMIR